MTSKPRAMGTEMPPISNWESRSETPGISRPRRRPAIMARPIQAGSHLSSVDRRAGASCCVVVSLVMPGAPRSVDDVWARVGTDEDVASLAVTVKAERRNRCHSGRCDRFGIGIGIDLDDLDSSFVFVGELVEYRCDLFARSAPRRPDVDDYGDVGIDDLGGECGVCDCR